LNTKKRFDQAHLGFVSRSFWERGPHFDCYDLGLGGAGIGRESGVDVEKLFVACATRAVAIDGFAMVAIDIDVRPAVLRRVHGTPVNRRPFERELNAACEQLFLVRRPFLPLNSMTESRERPPRLARVELSFSGADVKTARPARPRLSRQPQKFLEWQRPL
jgi:hypothetical protein